MAIEFEGTTDPPGFQIYDPVEQRRLHVRTSSPVEPTATDSEVFCFPVDTACVVETESLVLNQRYSVDIHDEQGQVRQNVETIEQVDLEPETNFIGLTGPIKLYCRVTDGGRIETGIDSVHITFDEPATVAIGARSLHEEPAGTIITPDDPKSMMQAVSALSSALKTTNPERTWPTLRGHPPLIELGPALDVPDVVAPPETDVTITIPPTYRNLYAVSPLSFFLGARIEPGPESALEVGGDASGSEMRTYTLGVERSLADDIARTLKQVFLLDCVVRTEGLYRYELHERTRLESVLSFDLTETYQEPLPVRLNRYLAVPYETVEPHLPRWPLTAHVPSTPAGVELLPFVVNELGIVREATGDAVDAHPNPLERTGSVTASSGTVRAGGVAAGSPIGASSGDAPLLRSASATRSVTEGQTEAVRFVRPAVEDESIEHAWFGDGAPIGASKATVEAYRNQLSRGPRNDSIEILLVCNDARMLDEHDVLDETYGSRESLPFEVHSEFGVCTDDLAALLTSGGYDFLHYIGHATADGLRCPDGELDVRTLSAVDIGVFFLNACDSYRQGLALARRGAFGGVATVGDVVNEYAVEVGQMMAFLLNYGFPLRASLELVEQSNPLGAQYLVVGDGSTDIAQSDGGPPGVHVLDRADDETVRYAAQFYNTKEFKLGTTTLPTFRRSDNHYLIPGTSHEETTTVDELAEYLIWTSGPMITDGQLEWNDGIGFDPFT